MSVAPHLAGLLSAVPPFPVRRFSLDEYHRMVQAGILTEDDPVELIDGWIAPKMPRSPLHDATVDRVCDVLRPLLPKSWRVRCQSAITIGQSETDPDVVVVRGPAERYVDHHPGSDEIALVVEIADTSLQHDREVKGKMYAHAGIGNYWIVDVNASQIEVYSDPPSPNSPHTAGYAARVEISGQAQLSVTIERDQIEVTAADLLPGS